MSCQILWHLFGFVLFHNPILIVMKDLENNSGLQTPNYKVLTNVIISATLYVWLSLCLSGADWCIRCSRYQRSFLSMKATQPIRAQCLEGSDQWEVSPLWAGVSWIISPGSRHHPALLLPQLRGPAGPARQVEVRNIFYEIFSRHWNIFSTLTGGGDWWGEWRRSTTGRTTTPSLLNSHTSQAWGQRFEVRKLISFKNIKVR